MNELNMVGKSGVICPNSNFLHVIFLWLPFFDISSHGVSIVFHCPTFPYFRYSLLGSFIMNHLLAVKSIRRTILTLVFFILCEKENPPPSGSIFNLCPRKKGLLKMRFKVSHDSLILPIQTRSLRSGVDAAELRTTAKVGREQENLETRVTQ